MCIICNCAGKGDELGGAAVASEFLVKFSSASQAMARATEAMQAVSRASVTGEDRARYDRTHKKMVRLLREWNRIEHERER